MPWMRKNGLALMPMRLNPFCSSASTNMPSSAPITVPEPPASAVPPMTAAAMAVNVIRVPPPMLGSIELIRNASRMPANAPSTLAIMKLPILIRLRPDAGLGGAEQVAADRDGVQAPPGPGEHDVEDTPR